MCSVTSIAVQCMCLGRYGDCTSAVCSLGDGGHPEHGSLEGKSGSEKKETLVCCYVMIFGAGCVYVRSVSSTSQRVREGGSSSSYSVHTM